MAKIKYLLYIEIKKLSLTLSQCSLTDVFYKHAYFLL